MIHYSTDIAGIEPGHVQGFFVGWPQPPSPETHLALLAGSGHVVLARDGDRVVGFIAAVSDGVLCAHITLLEVLPPHRGRGIGSELVRRMLEELRHYYAVDLHCDPDLQRFYSRLGLAPATGMMLRRYHLQSGRDRH